MSVNAKCEVDEHIVELVELLGFIEDLIATDSRDYIPVECELEYNGSEYYHEAYFYGVNYKPGALDAMNGDYSKISDDAISEMFLVQNLPLAPGKTVMFTLRIHPGDVDWVNGAGFQLLVPELATATITDTDDNGGAEPVNGVSSSGGGCDVATGSLLTMMFAGAMIFKTAKRKQ